MKCEWCHREYTQWDETAGDCPYCWNDFETWVKNGMTPGWNEILGNVEGEENPRVPTFFDWRRECKIRKDLKEGLISPEEAKRQAAELKEQLRKFYSPTQKDFEEERLSLANQSPVADNTYRSIPSLFD